MFFQKKNQEEKKSYDLDLNHKITKKICNLINKQYIYSNNYKKSNIINENFIRENIFSLDFDINNKIYNMIDNPYQKKLNLINLIFDSDLKFSLNNFLDIIKLFNWIYPLTIEYKFASGNWNLKTIKFGNIEKILLQNSISKIDSDEKFYLSYINKIKKILSNSNVKYYYFEFKSKRFNKIKDIIWIFDKNNYGTI